MAKNFERVTVVEFPRTRERAVNMMPFILGDTGSLPEDLRDYIPLIEACDVEATELGKVCYLTVTESQVAPSRSQRRGGVHTERHPSNVFGPVSWGGGWGSGHYDERRRRGLYCASNIGGTTALWDAHVDEPGPGGNCEHLLDELGESETLAAGELVWLTDACPHASLPVKKSCHRQFFRLVTSEVSLWYKDHSTPNPLGVELPANVRVLSGNKFA